jgi:hypothetical protein
MILVISPSNFIRDFFKIFQLILLLVSGLLLPFFTHAQIGSVRAEFDNNLGDWILYDYDDIEIGELKWIPKSRDYFSEWKIYIDGNYGRIAPKWRNDPNIWEASIGDDLITIQQIWRNDISAWRITDNKTQLRLETVNKNIVEEWVCETKNGQINIFTQYEFDIRDWLIEDTSETVSENLKTAIICFAIIMSISAS